MSLDPYHVVKDILSHLIRFHGAESILFQPTPAGFGRPYFNRVAEIERGIAVAAWYIDRLHAEYQRLAAQSPTPLFTLRLRRALARIVDLGSRMRRWGWNFNFSAGGWDQIKERLDAFEKLKFNAVLDAARSWRESLDVAAPALGSTTWLGEGA